MLHTTREVCTNELGSWDEGERVAEPFQEGVQGAGGVPQTELAYVLCLVSAVTLFNFIWPFLAVS